MQKAGKREELLVIFIHALAVCKGLKMSWSYFKAWKKRDSEQVRGRKHTEKNLCFHQGSLLFYNSQQCVSSVALLTVKKNCAIHLNREGTLEGMNDLPGKCLWYCSNSTSPPNTSFAGNAGSLLQLPSQANVVASVTEEPSSTWALCCFLISGSSWDPAPKGEA